MTPSPKQTAPGEVTPHVREAVAALDAIRDAIGAMKDDRAVRAIVALRTLNRLIGDAPPPLWVGLTTETGGVRWVPAEQADRERAIISLRVALTEAVDSHFDTAAALEVCRAFFLSVSDDLALVRDVDAKAVEEHVLLLRDLHASLRAKAEAWRKVLTDSEVGT